MASCERSVTIIIPVYNTEPYVERCVRSCLEQTWPETDIICVDDGSKDRSGEILDRLAGEIGGTRRLKVIHKANEGVVRAREAGIAQARGEFIFLVDSDDYLPASAVETLVMAADEKTDIVFGEFIVLKGGREVKTFRPAVQTYTGLDFFNAVMIESQGQAGGKMFRRKLYEAVSLDQTFIYNEDMFMVLQLARQARNVVRLNTPVYYYFCDHAVKREFGDKDMISMMRVQEAIKKYIGDHGLWRATQKGYCSLVIKNAIYVMGSGILRSYNGYIRGELWRSLLSAPVMFLKTGVRGRATGLAQLIALVSPMLAARLLNRYAMLRCQVR